MVSPRIGNHFARGEAGARVAGRRRAGRGRDDADDADDADWRGADARRVGGVREGGGGGGWGRRKDAGWCVRSYLATEKWRSRKQLMVRCGSAEGVGTLVRTTEFVDGDGVGSV